MKLKFVIAIIALFMVVMTGCGKKNGDNAATSPSPSPTNGTTATTAPTTAPTTAATTAPTTPAVTTAPTTGGGNTPDAVTTASIVDNEEAFLKAISKDGTWIICLTKDLTFDKELLLEGEFKNGKKDDGKDEIERKIALYAQDEKRNITARYTLTAPKLTISSPEASIVRGTFKGDIYVTATDFELDDATVEGNIYFTTKEAMDSFEMDGNSKVTGKKEMVK